MRCYPSLPEPVFTGHERNGVGPPGSAMEPVNSVPEVVVEAPIGYETIVDLRLSG